MATSKGKAKVVIPKPGRFYIHEGILTGSFVPREIIHNTQSHPSLIPVIIADARHYKVVPKHPTPRPPARGAKRKGK